MTDEELIARIATGDESAAAELFARYKAHVQDVIYHVGKGHGPADDILQDVFTNAFLKGDRFNPTLGTFKAWLGTITRNVTINYLRKGARAAKVEGEEKLEELVDGSGPASGLPARSQNYGKAIKSKLAKLKSPAREIVEMRLFEHKQFDAIASHIGIPVNTVKTTFYRTVKTIQADLALLKKTRNRD